jgi:hypothetical protein
MGRGKEMGMSRNRLLVAQVFGLVALFTVGMGLAGSTALGKGKPSGTQTGATDTVSTSDSTITTSASAGKALVCHRTHSKKRPSHTINVSVNAVSAHLAHGDTLGACVVLESASTTNTTTTHGKSADAKGHNK